MVARQQHPAGPPAPGMQQMSGLHSMDMEIDPEQDPKYEGAEGEQRYLADGQPYPLPVTIWFSSEYEPPSGDGWNEPMDAGGHYVDIAHIVTADGRDIANVMDPKSLQWLTEKIEQSLGS